MDLAQVKVTRKRAHGLSDRRIRTNLNFLSLITFPGIYNRNLVNNLEKPGTERQLPSQVGVLRSSPKRFNPWPVC